MPGGLSGLDLLDDIIVAGQANQNPVANNFVKIPFKPVVPRTQTGT